jgi:hypothetical protein
MGLRDENDRPPKAMPAALRILTDFVQLFRREGPSGAGVTGTTGCAILQLAERACGPPRGAGFDSDRLWPRRQ